MSLKFGIYLVEQRIITPQQFCGLIKIQQESVQTAAKIALQRNLLTIKQVSTLLDSQKMNPQKAFHQLAIEMNFLSTTDAQGLLKVQEASSTSIRELLVECELLTEGQSRVLYAHFERIEIAARAAQAERAAVAAAAPPTPSPKTQSAAPETFSGQPRQPKFKRRPVIHQKQVEV